MSTFIITKRTNGEFQFNLKADNGQVILTSEGYSAKTGCLNGVESVKKNATAGDNFERKTAGNGKYHFNLKSPNGQVIGSSQMYESESSREKGIESVKTNAPVAQLQDETA